MSALMISQEELNALVDRRVEAVLDEAVLLALAERAVEARIGRVTLLELQRVLGVKTERQARKFCAAARIPIRRFSRKRPYVLLRDIEAADLRAREGGVGTAVMQGGGTGGTSNAQTGTSNVERRAA